LTDTAGPDGRARSCACPAKTAQGWRGHSDDGRQFAGRDRIFAHIGRYDFRHQLRMSPRYPAIVLHIQCFALSPSDRLSERNTDKPQLVTEIVSAYVSKNRSRQRTAGHHQEMSTPPWRFCRASARTRPATGPGRICQEIDTTGLHRLPGGRQKAQDAQALSALALQAVAQRNIASAGTCRPTIPWWRPTMPRKRSDFAKKIGLGKSDGRKGKKKKKD